MASPSLAQSQLKDLIHYDPDTGVFTNRFSRSNKINTEADRFHSASGYKRISVNNVRYTSHRLAWFYMYGVWPKGNLDHINRVKDDNRLINLREVTGSQNCQNTGLRSDNTSGHKGISWSNGHRKWQAQIKANGVYLYLGRFINLDDAIAARKQAEEQLHSHRVVA
jgi:hypothetical protein